jgi:hypothetical protein
MPMLTVLGTVSIVLFWRELPALRRYIKIEKM